MDCGPIMPGGKTAPALHESEQVFLPVLACFLDTRVARNEKMLGVSDGQTAFHGYRPPSISTREYLKRVVEYSSCSPTVIVSALYYISQLEVNHGREYALSSLNTHRMLIAAVVVAVKFHEDVFYDNLHFARVGGLTNNELNILELEMLRLLDFRLAIPMDTYNLYETQILSEVMRCAHPGSTDVQRSIADAGLIPRELLPALRRDGLPCNTARYDLLQPTQVHSV
mmetsp:Transcript_11480/g.27880  ORF Transcript_11480/g.27880 Transcript_11480/m.27880 type:complete len:226 (-) Transcript_11480:73-750(-)